MIERLLMWSESHQTLLAMVSVVSLLLTLSSILAVPWLVARLPVDFFQYPKDHSSRQRHPVITVLRNVIGAGLVVLGLIMFITPGPGMIMVLLGLSASQFPGKQRLIKQVLASRRVFDSLNWIRQRRSQPPFLPPTAAD